MVNAFRIGMAGLAVAAGVLLPAVAASASPADSWEGCPSGAVCIYPQNAGWNNGHPSEVYYAYGAHNLSHDTGYHYFANYQTGGATTRTCTGYNGTGCQGYLEAGTFENVDLTPINSITLEP